MYKIYDTPRFKKDLKRFLKGKNKLTVLKLTKKLKILVDLFAKNDGKIPPIYAVRKHKKMISGEYARKGYSDAHITGDWVLIYKVDDSEKRVYLIATGTHSYLFNEGIEF